MIILAGCSFVGVIYTYYFNGRDVNANSFQIAMSLTLTFSVFLIISHIFIVYKLKKLNEKKILSKDKNTKTNKKHTNNKGNTLNKKGNTLNKKKKHSKNKKR